MPAPAWPLNNLLLSLADRGERVGSSPAGVLQLQAFLSKVHDDALRAGKDLPAPCIPAEPVLAFEWRGIAGRRDLRISIEQGEVVLTSTPTG